MRLNYLRGVVEQRPSRPKWTIKHNAQTFKLGRKPAVNKLRHAITFLAYANRL
jgi:hypothetical protein